MNNNKFLITLLITSVFTACGSGIVVVNNNNDPFAKAPAPSVDTVDGKQLVYGGKSQALGFDFPADLDLPNLAGVSQKIFVTLAESPYLLVLAADTLQISSEFKGLDTTQLPKNIALGSGSNTLIKNSNEAFLVTSSETYNALIYFNPRTGNIYQVFALSDPITLSQSLPLSDETDVDGDGIAETSISGSFKPSFASDVVVVGNKIFVSMVNLFFNSEGAYRVQGMVRVLQLNATVPFISNATPSYITSSGFNPSGLLAYDAQTLMVVNSGHFTYEAGAAVPKSDSLIDRIDVNTLSKGTPLNFGLVGLAFRSPALQQSNALALMGSFFDRKIYTFNANSFTIERGIDDPILLPTSSGDLQFISDVAVRPDEAILAVASFNDATLYGLDLSSFSFLSETINFTSTDNPAVTGLGPLAFRPGTPGEDFTGPDLFVIQGLPGILRSVQTY